MWGSTKGGAVASLDRAQADFPTAAEVAQGKLRTHPRRGLYKYDMMVGCVPKASDKAAPSDANAQKQAAEADTFRGVHLDPNAHHWDEVRCRPASNYSGLMYV